MIMELSFYWSNIDIYFQQNHYLHHFLWCNCFTLGTDKHNFSNLVIYMDTDLGTLMASTLDGTIIELKTDFFQCFWSSWLDLLQYRDIENLLILRIQKFHYCNILTTSSLNFELTWYWKIKSECLNIFHSLLWKHNIQA